MATKKRARKKHYNKRTKVPTLKRRRHRHYKRRHYKTSLKEYLSSDNRDTNVVKDTTNVSDPDPDYNNGNIIHGLRDLLSNKKK